MPLESATYISDLVNSNPPTSDLETQGANHLQLIKTVLQNVFGTSTRRFVGIQTVPTTISGTTVIPITNASAVHLVNTGSGALSITLPTLAASDAGWECSFMKVTTDVNPFFLVPPSGTIQSGEITGLAKCRRAIPGRRTRVIWTGTAFIAERVNSQPIGSLIPISSTGLPVGYEWANGVALSSSANYPEYNLITGGLGTIDARGRAIVGLDNPGGTGTAGRITVAGGNFDGTQFNVGGGLQNHVLVVAECPTGLITYAFSDPGHGHNLSIDGGGGQGSVTVAQATGQCAFASGINQAANHSLSVVSGTTGISSSITDHGGNAAHSILPPVITAPYIIVTE